jgi:hypothetical protein
MRALGQGQDARCCPPWEDGAMVLSWPLHPVNVQFLERRIGWAERLLKRAVRQAAARSSSAFFGVEKLPLYLIF